MVLAKLGWLQNFNEGGVFLYIEGAFEGVFFAIEGAC